MGFHKLTPLIWLEPGAAVLLPGPRPATWQVSMLDRLYTLYVTVITTIKGYGDYFWADVVEKIDEMGEQVGGGWEGRQGGCLS